jgi:hypothetical protein
MIYGVCLAVFVVAYVLGHSAGYEKAYNLCWAEDHARQAAMSPRQWRIAYGYEPLPQEEQSHD